MLHNANDYFTLDGIRMEDDIGVTLTAIPTRIAYDVSVTAVAARSLSILGREAVDSRDSSTSTVT